MIYHLMVWASGAIVMFVLGLMLNTAIVCLVARRKFIKANKGLPMTDDMSWLGNAALTWGLKRNLCTEIDQKHKQISKTIGSLYYDKPMVSTIDLDLIKRVHEEPNVNVNRVRTLHVPVREFEESIMMAEDEDWRRLRRGIAPAFKSGKFKRPNVMEEIDCSIDKFIALTDSLLSKDHEKGTRLMINNLVHRYTMNLHLSCFYKQPHVINFDQRPCRWSKMVGEGLKAIQTSLVVRLSVVFPLLHPLLDWIIFNFHPQALWRREIKSFLKRQMQMGLQARKEAKELSAAGKHFDPDNFTLTDGTQFKRNMSDHIVDQYLDGKLTQADYFSASFLMIASEETTAVCIIHTLYQLAVNQNCQQRLRESILLQGAESEYLGWVLNESLRLLPPTPITATRTLGREMEIDGGHLLPKGTILVTPAYSIHRLVEYWGEDADEFRPERWQDTSKHHPMQFIPFGSGPRGCVGKDFALYEMRRFLVALLSRYEFESQLKADANVFDSPFLVFVIPSSPTFLTMRRLNSTQSDRSRK